MANPFSTALTSIDEEPSFKYNNPWQATPQQSDYLSPAMGVSGQAFQGAKNAAQQSQSASAGLVNATNALQGLFGGEGQAFQFQPMVSEQVKAFESGSIDTGVPYLSGRQQTIARGGRLGAKAAAQEWEEAHPGEKAPLSISNPEEFQRALSRSLTGQQGAMQTASSQSGGRGRGMGGGSGGFMIPDLLDESFYKAISSKQQYGAGGGGPTRSIDEEIMAKKHEAKIKELQSQKEKELASLTGGRTTPGIWSPSMATTGVSF